MRRILLALNWQDSGRALSARRLTRSSPQQAYLKASNTDAGDLFGRAVAISGDTVVVGALMEASNATGVNGNQADNSAKAPARRMSLRAAARPGASRPNSWPPTAPNDYFGSRGVSGDTAWWGAL